MQVCYTFWNFFHFVRSIRVSIKQKKIERRGNSQVLKFLKKLWKTIVCFQSHSIFVWHSFFLFGLGGWWFHSSPSLGSIAFLNGILATVGLKKARPQCRQQWRVFYNWWKARWSSSAKGNWEEARFQKEKAKVVTLLFFTRGSLCGSLLFHFFMPIMQKKRDVKKNPWPILC